MEQDEFNNFQHPISQKPQKSHQLPQQAEPQIKEQGDMFANNFINFDDKNINPSSSLATMTFQQLSDNIDNKDFEDTNWPHLSKIQSQNLPTLEPNLITFQKSHSQSEHKIDLFDNSSTFFWQNKPSTAQNVSQNKEQLTTNQVQSIKPTQNPKLDQNFIFSAYIQTNPVPINNRENNLLGFENAFFTKVKQPDHAQFQQNRQDLVQEKKNVLNLEVEVQNDKFRKQSEQFVFSQPVQTVTIQTNKITERKQSEQFVFQSQQMHQQTFFTQNLSIPQQVNSEHAQKSANIGQIEQANFNSPKIDNQQFLNISEQENTIVDPTIVSSTLQMAQKMQEEDQFGDFEETVQNTITQSQTTNQIAQSKNQNHPSMVQLYEQQIPFGTDSFSKKKQLQSLIDSLPNYGFIFAQAVQSL